MSFWRRAAVAVACACIIAPVWLIAAPSFAGAALSGQAAEPDLGAILIDSRAVPPNFELDAQNSGFYEEPLPVPEWLSPIAQHAGHIRGYDRFWYDQEKRRAIVAQVMEYPLTVLVGADTKSVVQDFRGQAEKEFSVASVPHAYGFVIKKAYNGADAVEGIFVQGPRVYIISVITRIGASDADIELVRRLVEIQAAKAPAGSTELREVSERQLATGTALGTLGAAAAYIGGWSAIAWLRDPLRRRWRRRGTPMSRLRTLPDTPAADTPAVNAPVVDITTRARRRSRWAAAGVMLQLSGAGMMVTGLLPFTWPLGLLFVALGVGLTWVPRLVTATVRRAAPAPQLWTGRRRLRVTSYAAVSTGCVLSGLLMMVLYGVGAVLTSPGYDYNLRFFAVGVAFLTVGTLLRRRARRLAALDAKEMLRRDSRPMVLYLRTFADDSLTIRTAAATRRSFVDRLSPRRFERFEEVLVRHLTVIGPVVALNPPGTDLAPIGAARETLPADGWQPTITEWMTSAQLIVVGAAPEAMSPGFGWELRAIDSCGLWSKTLLLLPPVRDSELHARWERFATVFTDTAMAPHPVPADSTRILVLLGSPTAGWFAITADQRTERTYTEALTTAQRCAATHQLR